MRPGLLRPGPPGAQTSHPMGAAMVLQTNSAAVSAARELCRNLERVCRESRMYPEHHPTREGGFQQLVAATDRALAAAAPLRLVIEDTSIRVNDEVVYAGAPRSESLAYVLFRDGLRELLLYPGIRREELALLVDAIANVDSIDRWEHDLVTTLWEADFLHIDYSVADPLVSGAEISAEVVDSLRDVVLRRLAQAEEAVAAMSECMPGTPRGPEDTAGRASSDALRRLLESPLLDTETLQQMEADPCPLDNLYLFLARLLPTSETPEAAAVMIRALADEIGALIAGANLSAARDLITCVHEAAVGNPAVSVAIEHLDLHTAEMKDAVRLLVAQEGGTGGHEEEQADAAFLLSDPVLRPMLLPILLDLLAGEEDRAVRRSLLTVLTARRDIPAQLIASHLDDHRWYVVRNMVQLLAASPDARPDPHLKTTVHYPDERVRKEVVRTLERMSAAGQDSSPLLRIFLRDPDSGVRTLAARVVGPQVGELGMREVLGLIARPDFASRAESEIEAILGAVARLARAGLVVPATLQTLESLWRPHLWRRKPAALRAAALRATGAIPGAEATASLQTAAKSRDAGTRLLAGELLSRRHVTGDA